MVNYHNSPQWRRFLLHLGGWRGSFATVSIDGQITQETPSLVTLEGENDNCKVKQSVQRFPANSAPQVMHLEYTTLSRNLIFFADGSFVFGSMQHAPFSRFGAEFGFIEGDRRLRLVELFDPSGHFSSISLIRERREGTQAPEQPLLTVEALVGTWEGEAVTQYPDLRPPTSQASRLTIAREGDRLHQTLCTESTETLRLETQATIVGNLLHFPGHDGTPERRIILLPDGGSCNVPIAVPRQQAFFIEAGWLIAPTLRRRTQCNYDPSGACVSIVCITERKQTR